MTRIVILDETQGRNFAELITTLLRELGKEDAAKQFNVRMLLGKIGGRSERGK